MGSNTKVNENLKKIDFPDLESLLRKSPGYERLEVIDYSATSLVPPGENYCSIVVKLEATIRRDKDAKEEQLHLVAKTMQKIERPIVDWPLILKKEIFMYLELIPAYRDIEREAGIPESELIDLLPKYFGHRYSLSGNSEEVDEYSTLLLENMTRKGFYKYNKNKALSSGFDLDYTKMALSALARYHALGIALRHKRPDFFEKVVAQASVVGINLEHTRANFTAPLNDLIEDPSIAGDYLPIIKTSFEAFISWKRFIPSDDTTWSTITHGDFGMHNMMFHNDDQGNVDDVKFYDFQMYFYISALQDLPVFLVSSLHSDMFLDHIDEVQNTYYKDFINTLERVGIDTKIYTKASFDDEMKKQALDRFPLCVIAQKFLAFEVTEEHDHDTLIETLFQSKCNELVKDKLRKLIFNFEKRGWLSK